MMIMIALAVLGILSAYSFRSMQSNYITDYDCFVTAYPDRAYHHLLTQKHGSHNRLKFEKRTPFGEKRGCAIIYSTLSLSCPSWLCFG